MSRRGLRALWLLGLAALLALCAARLQISHSITHFMPRGEEADIAGLARAITDSELAHMSVVAVGLEDGREASPPAAGQLVAIAKGMAATLGEHPDVRSVDSGMGEEELEEIFELYFPRRLYLASPHPERELSELLSDTALGERARALRRELASPRAPLVSRTAPADPFGFTTAILDRLQADGPTLELVDGQFMTPDGRWAILFVESLASPFDSPRQIPLIAATEAAFERLAREQGGGFVLERSGVNRISVATESSIRRDVRLVSFISLAGVGTLFLLFFRSLTSALLAIFPAAMGIVFATALSTTISSSLHGVTLAFGISLVGVAVDYSIHVMNHHALLDRPGGPRATARHLRPTLMLGALTTVAGFAGLALSSLPGVREMGLFAMAGIASALVVALWGLPHFLSPQASPSRLQVGAAEVLGGWARKLQERPLRVAPLVGAALAAALLGLPRIHWADDPASLTRPDTALLAEDTRVRERVSQLDPGRLLIALADSEEEALALNERVWGQVEELRASGALGNARSLYAMLWSEGLQRRNRELLSRDPTLPDRVESIFAEAGFRPGSFAPFRAALADPEPAPLRAEDLEKGPLGRAMRSMLVRFGERHGAITYLGDVRSPEAVSAAADGIPGVHYFDQHELLVEIYTRYRERSLQLVALGCIFVFSALFLRYRALAPAAAAFLPSLLVAVAELGLFGLLGVEVNLLGLLSLILVMGMGVDYGIFLVDSASDAQEVGATMLSLLLSCMTTIFVFGTLALSPHPALRAVGLTAGVGIALAFVLAPTALTLLPTLASERPEAAGE